MKGPTVESVFFDSVKFPLDMISIQMQNNDKEINFKVKRLNNHLPNKCIHKRRLHRQCRPRDLSQNLFKEALKPWRNANMFLENMQIVFLTDIYCNMVKHI